MAAVLYRLRSDLRTHWHTMVALTLISGIGDGNLFPAYRTFPAEPPVIAL